MKNISVKQISIFGAVFMIILGSLLHFLYQFSSNNQIVALFSPVNESVWEHGKLFLLPLLVVAIVEYLKIRDLSKILYVNLTQLLIMLSFVFAFFYGYTGALGIENLFIDISSFVVAVIIGEFYSYRQLSSKKRPPLNKYVSSIALISIILAFTVFTYYPPDLPIFTSQNILN